MESQFLSPVGVPPHLRSEGIYRVHTSVYPAIGPNKFKKLTRLTAPVHNIRGKVGMKNNIYGFTDKLIVCEAMCTVFHSNFAA